jgi:hypothetical protein
MGVAPFVFLRKLVRKRAVKGFLGTKNAKNQNINKNKLFFMREIRILLH